MEQAKSKARKAGKIALLAVGGVAATAAFCFPNMVAIYFFKRYVAPVLGVLMFGGLIWLGDLGAPTQEKLISVVEENIELLDAAVKEAETLGEDAAEISTRAKTPGWQREELGDIDGMYLRLDGGDGPDTYEPLTNDIMRRVLDLRYVESIHIAGDGFSLDCGATGIVPSGAEYGVTYRPGLLAQLQTQDTLGRWPVEALEDGWLVRYGGDDALKLVPITDEWFYTKEVW